MLQHRELECSYILAKIRAVLLSTALNFVLTIVSLRGAESCKPTIESNEQMFLQEKLQAEACCLLPPLDPAALCAGYLGVERQSENRYSLPPNGGVTRASGARLPQPCAYPFFGLTRCVSRCPGTDGNANPTCLG